MMVAGAGAWVLVGCGGANVLSVLERTGIVLFERGVCNGNRWEQHGLPQRLHTQLSQA
jgi:hypothetical protein